MALEERTVPSPFGFGGLFPFGGFFGRGVASVPAQDARQVAQEFNTFQRTYSQDVDSFLPPRPSSPFAVRTAFNTAVATALGTLNSSIDSTIANLPAASSLDTTIQGELLGTGTNTLQTLLGAIPTPSGTGFRALRGFNRESSSFINQIEANVTNQVRTAAAPTGSISQTTIQQDLILVQTDFQSFSQTYFNDVQTILLQTGTTPSSNSPAFNQAVATALGTLNANIDTALGNLPASVTATLDTTIQNDLLTGSSTSGTSLQARLAALPAPATTTGFVVRLFQFSSSSIIASVQGQVTGAIVSAVNQYNAGLGGSTSSG
jgi:hypothetical protein